MCRTAKRRTMMNITAFLSRLRAIFATSCGSETSPSNEFSKNSKHGRQSIHQSQRIFKSAGSMHDPVVFPTDALVVLQDYLLPAIAGLVCKQNAVRNFS